MDFPIFPLVQAGHSGVNRAVAKFHPLPGEGHRKLAVKLLGF